MRTATLGAFVMTTGTLGKAGAVADIFGVGVKSSSESTRKAMNKDGSPSSCRTSKPRATDPPDECQSALRIELVAAGKDVKKDEALAAKAFKTGCDGGKGDEVCCKRAGIPMK